VEVTGDWRKLRNEELHDSYLSLGLSSGGQVKEDEMGGACGTYDRGEKCVQDFGWEN
jgi:hypothetical protein